MTRRKGERAAAQNVRECPNIVELEVPLNGLGTKLDYIHDFHRTIRI